MVCRRFDEGVPVTDLEQRMDKVEKDQNKMFLSLIFIAGVTGLNFGFFVGTVITVYLST